jgi:hypothetical protein
MLGRFASLSGVMCALVLMTPASLLADFYDRFDDGYWERDPNDPRYDPNDPNWTDPNIWDIDNPDWIIDDEIVGTGWYAEITRGWLRLWADSALGPYALLPAYPYTLDPDPNTSETVWDDTTSHYLLCKTANSGQWPDPNDDRSQFIMFMHADLNHWWALYLVYEYADNWPGRGAWVALRTINGLDSHGLRSTHVPGYPHDPNLYDPAWDDPNNLWSDPNFMNERDGFWIALQFVSDGVSGDPNGKSFRGAVWNGGKFDWDGHWTLAKNLGNISESEDWWPEWYWAIGECGFGSFSSDEFGPPSDVAIDHVEARVGVFTNVSHTLQLKVKGEEYGSLTINPDLLDNETNDPNDPNYADPNDTSELRRYTAGTEVVLVATPFEGRSFRTWKIWDDPNHKGDANYVSKDANAVLYLTMATDIYAECIFKCSSESVLWPIGMVFVALALGVVVRRAVRPGG